MKRILLALSVLSLSAMAYGALHRFNNRLATALSHNQSQWLTASNQLERSTRDRILLEDKVKDRKNELRRLATYHRVDPEILTLFKREPLPISAATTPAMRDRLNIGWENSENFVLITKSSLKKIGLEYLTGQGRVTATAREILAISPDEVSRLEQALGGIRQRTFQQMRRLPSTGNIVAHYEFPADPTFAPAISNLVNQAAFSILGQERAGIFFDQAWRAARGDLPHIEKSKVAMIIRADPADGVPTKLTCEIIENGESRSSEVRYAHYPCAWFFTAFPGGWPDLAQRAGFELPEDHNPRD